MSGDGTDSADDAQTSGRRALGIDPGEVRIGTALSDPLGMIAQPHSVIDRRREHPVDAIQRIVSEYEVQIIVVGLPTQLDGTEGASALRSRRLGDAVAEATGVPVVFWDERFTSVQAEQALLEAGMRRGNRQTTRDKVAAALLLQGYLDATVQRSSEDES